MHSSRLLATILYMKLEGNGTTYPCVAGYNRVGVVEYLLNSGADVHAKDKGGLVPLHNACSYGHYEVSSRTMFMGRKKIKLRTLGYLAQSLTFL
jgi:ankyrin repeat protein